MTTKTVEEEIERIVETLCSYNCFCPEESGACVVSLNELRTTLTTYEAQIREEEMGKRNSVIKEYKAERVMFVLKVEDGKTYEAYMPIPKWAEVGKLEFREHKHEWEPCTGGICTSDLHSHHCKICGKHGKEIVGDFIYEFG